MPFTFAVFNPYPFTVINGDHKYYGFLEFYESFQRVHSDVGLRDPHTSVYTLLAIYPWSNVLTSFNFIFSSVNGDDNNYSSYLVVKFWDPAYTLFSPQALLKSYYRNSRKI